MAIQLETLVVTLEASVKQFQAQLLAATRDTHAAMARIEAEINKGSQRVEASTLRLGRGIRGGFIGYITRQIVGNIDSAVRAAAELGDKQARAYQQAWDAMFQNLPGLIGAYLAKPMNEATQSFVKDTDMMIRQLNKLRAVFGLLPIKTLSEAASIPGPQETIIRKTFASPYALTNPQARGANPLASPEIEGAIADISKMFKISADTIREIMREESNFVNNLTSKAGAQGLMQLTPETQRRYGVTNPFNIRENIFGGVANFASEYRKYGNLQDALVAYNASSASRAKYFAAGRDLGVLPQETQKYVADIMGRLGNALTATAKDQARIAEGTPAAQFTPQQLFAAQHGYQPTVIPGEKPEAITQLKQTNDEMEHQIRLLHVSGLEQAQLNAIWAAGVQEDSKLADSIRKHTAELYNQQRVTETVRQLNDDLASSAETFAQALLQGSSATQSLNAALQQLASQLLNMAFQDLFRGSGSQGGLLGDLLGGTGLFRNQAGGVYKVGGSSGEHAVALAARSGEMITVTPRGLSARSHGGGVSVGGTVITIQGNADEKTIAIMDRRLQAAQAKQMRELSRQWGNMTNKYQQLRGP